MSFNLKIAKAAAERWRTHRKESEENQARISHGEIAAIESEKRINARLERLRTNAMREQARVAEVAAAAAEISDKGLSPTQLIEKIGLERVIGKRDFLNVSFLELALAVRGSSDA